MEFKDRVENECVCVIKINVIGIVCINILKNWMMVIEDGLYKCVSICINNFKIKFWYLIL